jgi:hypothetical protein
MKGPRCLPAVVRVWRINLFPMEEIAHRISFQPARFVPVLKPPALSSANFLMMLCTA